MNAALRRSWYESMAPGATMVCAGDIGGHRTILGRWRPPCAELPGPWRAVPASDVDVLVLVGDAPAAVGNARDLIYGDDDPDGVGHNVVVRTEADWLRDQEKELPFPRNVEAEGVQIHPVHRPARRRPGGRPPVTRKGIRHAVPIWLKEAGSDLKTLAYEIKELKDGRFKYPGMAARPAFDAVFFSAMAWCLTRA